MKTMLSLFALTSLMLGSFASADDGKPEDPRQILFHVRILEGDPLGSVERGTVKVLSRPLIRMLDNS